jgi:hypothetical protein
MQNSANLNREAGSFLIEVMATGSYYGIGRIARMGRVAKVAVVVVLAVVVIGAGVYLSSLDQTPTGPTSLLVTTTGGPCTASPDLNEVGIPQNYYYEQCLGLGDRVSYGFLITASFGLTFGGKVLSQYPVKVELVNLNGVGGIMFLKNSTTDAQFKDIESASGNQYEVVISNVTPQNNTFSLSVDVK